MPSSPSCGTGESAIDGGGGNGYAFLKAHTPTSDISASDDDDEFASFFTATSSALQSKVLKVWQQQPLLPADSGGSDFKRITVSRTRI